MCSGVTASAATIRSPSFSRSASSTTMSALPILISAMPSSIELIGMGLSPTLTLGLSRYPLGAVGDPA